MKHNATHSSILITEEYHNDNRGASAIRGDPKLSKDPPAA
jgi:hypothetical protein